MPTSLSRALLFALTFTLLFAHQGNAVELDKPICEVLLYKENPSDKLFTINVSGLALSAEQARAEGEVVFVGADMVNINRVSALESKENRLVFGGDGQHLSVVAFIGDHSINIINYDLREKEPRYGFTGILSYLIIGNCLVNIGEEFRGKIIVGYGLNTLMTWCDVAQRWTLLCSPFFLSREVALSADLFSDEGEGQSLDSDEIRTEADVTRDRWYYPQIAGTALGIENPCYVLATYLSDKFCRRLFP